MGRGGREGKSRRKEEWYEEEDKEMVWCGVGGQSSSAQLLAANHKVFRKQKNCKLYTV